MFGDWVHQFDDRRGIAWLGTGRHEVLERLGDGFGASIAGEIDGGLV